jgi:Na+/proline symporter
MSDIGPIFGPLDVVMFSLIIGAAVGALTWRRHRISGALLGAGGGLLIWLAGFVLWKARPWG